MIYCPYTNNELTEPETSPEHIIPLSLGGIDNFTIPVCKKFNTLVGSKIDGALANDFLVLLKRKELDTKGHNKRPPKVYLKKSINTQTGKPIQLVFDKDKGLMVWCPISKEFLNDAHEFHTTLKIDTTLPIRFVAKTALSAGYYAYGDYFKNFVDHEELRFIMQFDPQNDQERLKSLKTRAYDRFSPSVTETEIFIAICSDLPKGSSAIALIPGPANIGIFVWILDSYIGTLNVPADTSSFPNDGHYDLGHFICIQNGALKRQSIRAVLEAWHSIHK